MGMITVKLRPGVNTELTPVLNEASYSVSNLARFRAGLAEKIGGWERYYAFAVGGVPKCLHAWQDLNETDRLAVGTTTLLGYIEDAGLTDITPQTVTSDLQPDFATTASSPNVTITDSNIADVTDSDSIEFKTPVAVGGLILSGVYPIDLVLSSTSYRIIAASNATATRANATITAITQANPGSVTTSGAHGFSTGDLIYISGVLGMTQVNSTRVATITGATQANPCVITATAHGFSNGDTISIYGVVGMTQLNGLTYTVASAAANTFELSGVNSTAYTAYSSGGTASRNAVLYSITSTGANTFTIGVNTSGYGAYTSGGTASPAAVPLFGTTSGSSTVDVTLAGHGLAVGDTINFPLSTTIGGVTIEGTYAATAILSGNRFSISVSNQASSTASAMMNSGQVELEYYIALGAPAASAGYSIGTYGSGGYGTGAVPTAQTGTAITATDWTLDNWGQALLACPHGGAIYYWIPATGYSTAQPLTANGAPIRNTGMFVSMQTQMVIAYGSTEPQTIGLDTDPLLVKWCAQGDYLDWETTQTNQAGSRRLPTGSKIVSGMSVPLKELLWTDLDLWSMSYIGFPDAWGFTKIGSSCGLIGKRAATRLGANVYWMGPSNFFVLGGGGVQTIPCTVWDAVFQDINTTYQDKCWTWANTPFNEVWFFYPRESTSATEPDAYVKYNTLSGEWDYGADDIIDRSTGIDQSILGKPIAASPGGIIYQHESGYNGDGTPLNPVIETGWFTLSEGHDVVFVDWIIPDMKFVTYGSANQSAQVQVTLYSTMYPSDTPRAYGPYTFTSATPYINTRLRGRYAKMRIESDDADSFWRLGGIKLRIAQAGTR